jgi:NTE family protein
MRVPRVPEPNFNRPAAEQRTGTFPAEDGVPGITLALGGGFSRGFAHLGVLEVLEQAQVPVCAIVGTSIGGLLGAAYADGISVRDLCDLGRRVRIRDFLRFHQSQNGEPGERKDCLGKFVQDWFSTGRIEDLRIPTTIVATDLDSGSPFLFTRGPVEIAVRATCAFPGLVKPVEYEGHLLADGCIVAPVPTEIAASISGGCVLGVSVGSNDASTSAPENVVRVFDSSRRASHRRAPEPSWSRRSDILLEPQVHHIAWNDFSRVDEAFSAGAEATRRALPALREMLARQSEIPLAQELSLRAESRLAS